VETGRSGAKSLVQIRAFSGARTARQCLFDAVRRHQMTAPENAVLAFGSNMGAKNGKPQNVIQMRVTEQNIGVRRNAGGGQREARTPAKTTAGVKDQQMRPAANLDTHSVLPP